MMKYERFIGKVTRQDWLGKPVYFSQSQIFDKKDAWQLKNREVMVEYDYDITFELKRKLSEKERIQMQNAINSIFIMNGDSACNALYIWSRMYHASAELTAIMANSDIDVTYLAKRYVIANAKEIGFVSDYQVFIDNRKKEETILLS